MRFAVVLALATIAAVAGRPGGALAWSRAGHRVIAIVAAGRLHAGARAAVAALLRGDPAGATLPRIAAWADDVRDARPRTYNWHFVDIPLGRRAYDPARDCHPEDEAARGDCVVAALEREIAKLRDGRLGRTRRAEALKFVTHLVGDLHQPLHCAERGHDRGGNGVLVTFFGRAYEPSPAPPRTHWNLHAVWDRGLIERAGRGDAAYARRLETWLATQDADAIARASVVEWANESHDLAATRAYRGADGAPLPVKGARLGKAYYDANIAEVDRQLAKAGVRLARVLNEAFP